jgi:Necrosis inducing protein (NPP1)
MKLSKLALVALQGISAFAMSSVLVPGTSHAFNTAIPHDQVRAIPTGGEAYMYTFQPKLSVYGGCVPFPAVQSDGHWNAGLESTGSANGGCSSNGGQIYSRVAVVGGYCGVMYSWYFPKDGNVFSGHRHDWENIVVWLSSCSSTATIKAISYSAHGGYSTVKQGSLDLDGGTHPKVKYYQNGVYNFSLAPNRDAGGMHPLIAWGRLSVAARDSLQNANFGKANVPFKDGGNFTNNMNAARSQF